MGENGIVILEDVSLREAVTYVSAPENCGPYHALVLGIDAKDVTREVKSTGRRSSTPCRRSRPYPSAALAAARTAALCGMRQPLTVRRGWRRANHPMASYPEAV